MEVNFLIKKIVSAILLPLPWVVLSLLIGLGLLWFTRELLWGKIFITLGFLLLLVSALPFIPDQLLKNLEGHYPPLMQSPVQVAYIVVLGGGYQFDKSLPANSQLKETSLSRLSEGIRLYRIVSGAKLVLSGGVFSKGGEAESIAMQKVAITWGVPPQDIVVETTAKDTYAEAITLQPLLGDKPFLLVTSAYHMPRAMYLFESVRMHPIAAPAGYYLRPSGSVLSPNLVISPKNMLKMDTAIHEYLGMWWERIKLRRLRAKAPT